MTSTHPRPPRAALRRMLAEPDVLVLPGVYDALSASLAQRSGFRGAYMTGAGVSMSLIGHPDLGFTTLTEMAGQVGAHHRRARRPARRRRRHRVRQPVERATDRRRVPARRRRRDAHRGPGVPEALRPPRRQDGHPDGRVRREGRAAVEARTDPDLVLIARTDARAPLGFAESIDRANRRRGRRPDLRRGAAVWDEIARIPQEVDAPVMYNWVTGGHSPAVELEQLQEWGYAMAIIPGLLIGTVVRAMIQALAKAGAPTPMSAQSAPG